MWCFIFCTNFATTAHEHFRASSAYSDIYAGSAHEYIHLSSANRDIHVCAVYTHRHTNSPDGRTLSAYPAGTWQIRKRYLAGSRNRAIPISEWSHFIGRVCHWGG